MIGWFMLGAATATVAGVAVNYIMSKQRQEYRKALNAKDAEVLRLTAGKCYQSGRGRANSAYTETIMELIAENKTLEKRLSAALRANGELRRELDASRGVIEVSA